MRTYTTSTGEILSDEVARAVTGDVTSGTELGITKNYAYDTAGRLVEANIGTNNFKYSYDNAKSTTACSATPNANPNSGKDSNRTWQSINGLETTYCYDYADRLISSTNPLYVSNVSSDFYGYTASSDSLSLLTI